MKFSVIIHEAEEGGYWAEVPALPGCASQGENMTDLIESTYEAIEGSLSIDTTSLNIGVKDTLMELAV